MKKLQHILLQITFILLLTAIFVPIVSFAKPCGNKLCDPIKAQSFAEFVNNILDVVIQIGYVVIVFFIVYCGFLFVTARGNPEQLSTAKTALLWTCIGAAILLGAKVLETAIQSTVTSLQS